MLVALTLGLDYIGCIFSRCLNRCIQTKQIPYWHIVVRRFMFTPDCGINILTSPYGALHTDFYTSSHRHIVVVKYEQRGDKGELESSPRHREPRLPTT